MGDALRHAAGVDEHERGAVRFDQIDQAIVDLLPDFADMTASSGESGTSMLSSRGR